MSAAENRLIELLPPEERRRLLALCEPVPLARCDVLHDSGSATRFAHFPNDGFVSLVRQAEGEARLEVGMVGHEGMLGAHLVLGVTTSPLRAVVHGPGTAWRVPADALRVELTRSAALRRCLHRYLHVLMVQQATLTACLHFHQLGPRLARWLLMSHDRVDATCFHVTHELLAAMLGVRRVGITIAAGALQQRGLIEYHRGTLKVLDRSGLEAAACSCYAADRQVYAERMG